MTEPVARKTVSKDDFHKERSRFLDAFAALEEALSRTTPPTYEKLCSELQALRHIRNDVVHSTLKFIQFEGALHALVVNAQDSQKPARPARILKPNDLPEISNRLKTLSKSLANG